MLKNFKLFTLAMIFGVVLLSMNASPVYAASQSKALAHRGLHNSNIEENTVQALEGAHNLNAHIETDVFLTKDDKVVIHHDKSLDRMTNCSGDISTWLLSDIREQCRTELTNQPVATFNEYTKTLKDNTGQIMNVEVKGGGWYEDNDANIKQLRNIALNNGVINRVYFSEDATIKVLESFRDSAPDAKTMWKPTNADDITIKRANELSVNGVMAFHEGWTSKEMVTRFKNNNFKTWTRLSDKERDWKLVYNYGIEAQMTDEPRAFNKYIASRD